MRAPATWVAAILHRVQLKASTRPRVAAAKLSPDDLGVASAVAPAESHDVIARVSFVEDFKNRQSTELLADDLSSRYHAASHAFSPCRDGWLETPGVYKTPRRFVILSPRAEHFYACSA
jgi:hypothetical protein